MMSNVTVVTHDPTHPKVIALLEQSHALMQDLFEEEDNHYLEVSELCADNIAFFVAKVDQEFLGCVALANKGTYGEIKSMFVDPKSRGLGVGAALMNQLDAEGQRQGLSAINLETGDVLHEARRLYARFGYSECGPFGDYELSPASVFMTKPLTDSSN